MSGDGRTWREAVALPWLLMAVALLGSLRFTLDGELRVVAPALSALVLMLLFVGVLVRSGQFVPARLLDGSRGPLAVAVGATVVVALGWASASVLSLVTPESGLPRLAVLVLLAALLGNTLAASPGRVQALRALFVASLAGFVVKFVVLDALSAPERGLGARVVSALIEGVTLGGLAQAPWAPATGYLAFATLLLFFVALMLLPHAGRLQAGPRDDKLARPRKDDVVVVEEES